VTTFLAYLAKPKYGGWPTYTAHLLRGLRSAGHDAHIIKHGNKTERMTRPFGRKLRYQNVNRDDLIATARSSDVLITAVDKTYYELAVDLIDAGASIVVHDPTEMKEPLRSALPEANVIVIRESMLQHLPHASFIPHPYAARALEPTAPKRSAVSISRVDFDKHTELIVAANLVLQQAIDIYGALNGLYGKIKLDEIDPEWKENYKGRFTADDLWAAVRIAATYERVVDMSVIKGDGGGSQYTFLEAADAGASLILNAEWNPSGALADYADIVSTSDELVEAVTRPTPNRLAAADHFLKNHDARLVADQTVASITRRTR
jgi:hypothetical protein